MNRYFKASVGILTLFILIALLVSPRLSFNVTTSIIKSDSSAFFGVNNSHFPAFNKLMIWLTKYGRDVFWPIVIILLFVFGGWSGRKTATVIAISMLVLIPLGIIAKDLVSRPRPEIPKADFLVAADKDYGFPSGEAVIVSAGAAVALALYRDTSRELFGGILLGVGVSFIFVGMDKHIESLLVPIVKILKKP